MLELAYWIGPQVGVWNQQVEDNRNLWQYRDMRQAGRTHANLRDRWVVFHLHFDETRGVFYDYNGHTYAGYVSQCESVSVQYG